MISPLWTRFDISGSRCASAVASSVSMGTSAALPPKRMPNTARYTRPMATARWRTWKTR